VACLLAYDELPVRHLPASSWWPFPRIRSDIRTLAARIPIPGPHAGFKHGNVMNDHGRGGTQRPGATSDDPGHFGIRLVSDVGPGRQGNLVRGWALGAVGGIPRGCVLPGAGVQAMVAGLSARDARRAGKSAGAAGIWDAVTAPACRAARPGTG
jgi:hypothetical protein